MGWTLLLILQQDYDWWGGGGSVQFGVFPKDGFDPVWRENQGSYGGTQITSGACENDDYRTILAIFVNPPVGYYYTGTQPLSVDVTAGTVTNCP